MRIYTETASCVNMFSVDNDKALSDVWSMARISNRKLAAQILGRIGGRTPSKLRIIRARENLVKARAKRWNKSPAESVRPGPEPVNIG